MAGLEERNNLGRGYEMNLPQKIILVIGAILLLIVCFSNPPTRSVVEPNPQHIPYSRMTSAYMNVTEPDYTLIFRRVVGVVGAAGVAFVLAKTKE
jgi:hypothetical protein